MLDNKDNSEFHKIQSAVLRKYLIDLKDWIRQEEEKLGSTGL